MLPLSLWDNNCHDDDDFHHNEDDGNEGDEGCCFHISDHVIDGGGVP